MEFRSEKLQAEANRLDGMAAASKSMPGVAPIVETARNAFKIAATEIYGMEQEVAEAQALVRDVRPELDAITERADRLEVERDQAVDNAQRLAAVVERQVTKR